MTDFIRARSAKQKQERMAEIMHVADALFQSLPYSDITLTLIGRDLGWSRANLYKYVSTKEEIFLRLHREKHRAYFADLEISLPAAPADNDLFARAWAKTTTRHTDFLDYQGILVSVIEANVSLDELTEFKRGFAEIMMPIVDILSRQCGIEANDARNLYYCLIYQACGLNDHYHCAELAREAMRRADFPPITGSFEDSYARFALMCLRNAQERCAF